MCDFLGNSLVLWFSKKQNSIVIFIAEVEYIANRTYYAQTLWIKNYGIILDHSPILYDNKSARNSVCDSRAKHIENRHHFFRDHGKKNGTSPWN